LGEERAIFEVEKPLQQEKERINEPPHKRLFT